MKNIDIITAKALRSWLTSEAKILSSLKLFSRAFHNFLYTQKPLALLPGCGWNERGCRSLMSALLIWFGPDLTKPVYITKREEDRHAEHALIQIGCYYIDGDGVSSHRQLVKRWLSVERLPSVIVRPFNTAEEPNHHSGEETYYIDEQNIEKLVKLIDSRFNKENVLQLLGKNSQIILQDSFSPSRIFNNKRSNTYNQSYVSLE
jgi:hypothetical protein